MTSPYLERPILTERGRHLLGALKSAKHYIEQLASTVNYFNPGKVRAEDFTEKVCSAIAKAEGR